MSGAAQLPGAPGERLALPARPDGGASPWRRRAALALAALALAALAVPAATGKLRLPRRGPAAAAPDRSAPQAAAVAGRAPAPAQSQSQAQPRAAPRPAPVRVVAPAHAPALFAQHSWYVPPPPAPVRTAPPPPPPAPAAPPFPYTFVGSYAPGADPPVFFLARGDRVIDARVGDRLDGVYRFESAAGDQLVFVYLPLDVRQSLAASVTR